MTNHEFEEDDLIVQSSELALMNIASLAQTGALDLSPRFQRRNRWNRERQSKLIESFIMNAPVPPVYLAEEQRGRFAVIDGKQRLTAIADFLANRFRLQGLTFRPELDGRSFEELGPERRSTLEMRPLRVVTVMRQTPEWVKYEVFLRLNTGGQPLNAQEIRNVAFSGALNDLLLTLSEHPFLRHQLKIKNESSPAYADMSDVEFVLRFFTMASDWEGFSGNLRDALDQFMLQHADLTDRNANSLASRFTGAIESCAQIWGADAFKRFDGQQWRDQMLGGVYDAQMVAADLLGPSGLQRALADPAAARDAMATLFREPEFEASVRTATNTPSRVRYRIERVADLLANV